MGKNRKQSLEELDRKQAVVESAWAYYQAKLAADEAIAKAEARRSDLMDVMLAKERVVLEDAKVAIEKQEKRVVDQTNEALLMQAINSIVPNGYRQCFVAEFSVAKVHALEELHPKLKERVPYVPKHAIVLADLTPEEEKAVAALKAMTTMTTSGEVARGA